MRSAAIWLCSKPIWAAMSTLLEITGLEAGYGRIRVLKQVTLTVASGEVVAIIGANGAGKTTLLRTISGLIVPNAGRIALFERPIGGLPAEPILRFGVSLVTGGRRGFQPRSGHDNLAHGHHHR